MEKIREDEERSAFSEEANSLWMITFSPLVWAVHFAISYAGTAIYCAKIAPVYENVVLYRLGIVTLTLAALAAIGWLGWRSWQQWDFMARGDHVHAGATDENRHEFLGHAAFLLAIISFIGVVYVAMPILFIASCI